MDMQNKIRDRFWLWGHPANSLKGSFGLTLDSHVTPVDGVNELGIKNLFYVLMSRKADLNEYNAAASSIAKVGWSVDGTATLEKILEQAASYPNIERAIFDDFFSIDNEGNWDHYTVQQLIDIRERIHAAGLSMWSVYYERDLYLEAKSHLEVFDGVSFWFWSEPTVEQYHECLEKFVQNTPGKSRLLGCYLYNFGLEKEAAPELVIYQLEQGKQLIKDGIIEGIILHTNAVGGMGFAAYEAAREWMEAHGDEELVL